MVADVRPSEYEVDHTAGKICGLPFREAAMNKAKAKNPLRVGCLASCQATKIGNRLRTTWRRLPTGGLRVGARGSIAERSRRR